VTCAIANSCLVLGQIFNPASACSVSSYISWQSALLTSVTVLRLLLGLSSKEGKMGGVCSTNR
jgi:hypothetical protein